VDNSKPDTSHKMIHVTEPVDPELCPTTQWLGLLRGHWDCVPAQRRELLDLNSNLNSSLFADPTVDPVHLLPGPRTGPPAYPERRCTQSYLPQDWFCVQEYQGYRFIKEVSYTNYLAAPDKAVKVQIQEAPITTTTATPEEPQRPKRSPRLNTGESPLSRQTRAIPALIAFLAAFGVTGGFFGLFSNAELRTIREQITADRLEQRQANNFLVAELHENRVRIAALTDALSGLNQTQLLLQNDLKKLLIDQEVSALVDVMQDTVTLVHLELSRVTTGLDALFQRSLSPLLVNQTRLERDLTVVNSFATGAGFVAPLSGSLSLYQLETAFMVTKEGGLTIFLHAPLMKPSSVLTIYEHLNMPVSLEPSPLNLQLQPGKELIAISADKKSFLLLDKIDLRDCVKFGVLHLCKNTNYLLGNPAQYCLSALFLQNRVAARKVCPAAVVPHETIIRQIGQDQFFIFHPAMHTLQVDCPDPKILPQVYPFRGSRLINVGPGCTGFAEDYSVSSHPEFNINQTTTTSSINWRLGEMTHNLSLRVLDVMIPTPPLRKIPVEDLVANYQAMVAANSNSPIYHAVGLSTVSLVLIVIAVFCALCCFRSCLISCFQQEEKNDLPESDEEANAAAEYMTGLRRRRKGGRVWFEKHNRKYQRPNASGLPPPYVPSRSTSMSSLYNGLSAAAHNVGRLSPMPAAMRLLRPITPVFRAAAAPFISLVRPGFSRSGTPTQDQEMMPPSQPAPILLRTPLQRQNGVVEPQWGVDRPRPTEEQQQSSFTAVRPRYATIHQPGVHYTAPAPTTDTACSPRPDEYSFAAS
jgi:hypothetical protein